MVINFQNHFKVFLTTTTNNKYCTHILFLTLLVAVERNKDASNSEA